MVNLHNIVIHIYISLTKINTCCISSSVTTNSNKYGIGEGGGRREEREEGGGRRGREGARREGRRKERGDGRWGKYVEKRRRRSRAYIKLVRREYNSGRFIEGKVTMQHLIHQVVDCRLDKMLCEFAEFGIFVDCLNGVESL